MKGNILRSKEFILDNIKNKSTLNGYAILSHPSFDSCKTLQDQIILFHRLSPETTITSIISINSRHQLQLSTNILTVTLHQSIIKSQPN